MSGNTSPVAHCFVSSTLARKRILVAEDDAIIAMLAKSVIEELGFESAGCVSACDEALAALQHETPDLILLDVNLGGITSERVLQAAIELSVPVLISSGNDPMALPPAFGGFPLLTKPWTSDEFAMAAEALFPVPD